MSLSLEQASAGSFCLTKVGLAIGSSTNQLSTTNSATYTLDGVYQTAKAATATFALALPTGFVYTNIPNGGKAAFGVWLDSAGTFTVTQGAIVAASSNADKASPPPNPGSRALVGVVTVYNNSGAVFIPGTTAFNVAGATTTYFDMFSLPASGF